MTDFAFITIWLGIMSYWVYCHYSFRAALKAHEPAMYRENNDWFPIKYAAGFAWVDLALSNGYSASKCNEVIEAGDRLKKAYEAKFKLIGYGIWLSSIWFAISWSWISLQ